MDTLPERDVTEPRLESVKCCSRTWVAEWIHIWTQRGRKFGLSQGRRRDSFDVGIANDIERFPLGTLNWHQHNSISIVRALCFYNRVFKYLTFVSFPIRPSGEGGGARRSTFRGLDRADNVQDWNVIVVDSKRN